MRIRFIIVLTIICSNSYSQIDSLFSLTLRTAFTDSLVSNAVFTTSYQNENAAYIYFNPLFEKFVFDTRSMHIKMATYNLGKTLLWDVGGKPVYLFKTVMIINSLSTYQVDKAIVIDSFRLRGKSAKLSMHTTSLDSKRWHKDHGTDRFVKIECLLAQKGTKWEVVKAKITNTKFKALPDA